MKPCSFIPKPKKSKKTTCTKIPYIFRTELSTTSIKKIPHIFSEKWYLLYSSKRNTALFCPSPKNKRTLHPGKTYCNFENGNSPPKKIIIFQETELPYILSPKIKKFLIISGGKLYFLKK